MKKLIVLWAFLSTGCVMAGYQPEQRCGTVGILVETISIDHNQVGEVETIKTHIECKRLP